jgi:hypothetical protein
LVQQEIIWPNFGNQGLLVSLGMGADRWVAGLHLSKLFYQIFEAKFHQFSQFEATRSHQPSSKLSKIFEAKFRQFSKFEAAHSCQRFAVVDMWLPSMNINF